MKAYQLAMVYFPPSHCYSYLSCMNLYMIWLSIKGHVLHINIYPVITHLAAMQWLTYPPMHSWARVRMAVRAVGVQFTHTRPCVVTPIVFVYRVLTHHRYKDKWDGDDHRGHAQLCPLPLPLPPPTLICQFSIEPLHHNHWFLFYTLYYLLTYYSFPVICTA